MCSNLKGWKEPGAIGCGGSSGKRLEEVDSPSGKLMPEAVMKNLDAKVDKLASKIQEALCDGTPAMQQATIASPKILVCTVLFRHLVSDLMVCVAI